MRQHIRLTYNECFNDEPKSYLEYLNGISRIDLLKLSTSFISRENETIFNYLSTYFSEKNNEYVNSLWDALQKKIGNIDNYIVTNIESSLRFHEYVLDNVYADTTTLSEEKIEINIFKFYLLLNTTHKVGEDKARKSVEGISPNKPSAMLLAQMFKYFDITNHNTLQELYVQTIKAIYLYSFLSKNETTSKLYEKYLTYYGFKDWQELMAHITPFAYLYLGRKDEKGNLEITVDIEDEEYENKCSFIEKFFSENNITDIDFRNLRSNPICKLDKGRYLISYVYFFIELIYKGVYFKLSKLNRELPNGEKIKEFRSFYCDHFSERVLLYDVLKDIYKNKYVQKSGEEIKTEFGIDAEPDYYIRNGNKIFLFESKDILIASEAKTSNDYNIISKELEKRLYYEDKKGTVVPKAILQLLNNVKKILSGSAEWDKKFKKDRVVIYPIIILHDNIYNCLGIDDLVNDWFSTELDNMKGEYDISRIKTITIINIDVFIAYAEHLKSPDNSLDKLISSYHNSKSIKSNLKLMSEEVLTPKYIESLKSFENYLSKLYKPDYKKLLQEAVKTYVTE